MILKTCSVLGLENLEIKRLQNHFHFLLTNILKKEFKSKGLIGDLQLQKNATIMGRKRA